MQKPEPTEKNRDLTVPGELLGLVAKLIELRERGFRGKIEINLAPDHRPELMQLHETVSLRPKMESL